MQVTSQTPTLNDTLSAQGAIAWQGDNTAGDQCTFTRGALHVIGPKGGVPGCLDSAASFGNFALQVKLTIIQGDTAGTVFLAHVAGNNFNQYGYSISADGSYAFSSVAVDMQNHTGSNPQLLSGGHSSAINTAANQPNVLTLIARNQTIYLYINKQYVTTVTEAVTSAMAIGFIGAGKATQVPVDIACNNFQVWSI